MLERDFSRSRPGRARGLVRRPAALRIADRLTHLLAPAGSDPVSRAVADVGRAVRSLGSAPTPGDIKCVVSEVLRQRVVPTYEADVAGLSSDRLVARVLETVPERSAR